MWTHTRMLKGRVNTGRSKRLFMDARALDTTGLRDGDFQIYLWDLCVYACVCEGDYSILLLQSIYYYARLEDTEQMVSHHIMDMKTLGRRSHQYQSPLLENTAISSPTRMPLYPYSPAAIAPLRKETNTLVSHHLMRKDQLGDYF